MASGRVVGRRKEVSSEKPVIVSPKSSNILGCWMNPGCLVKKKITKSLIPTNLDHKFMKASANKSLG